MTKERLAAVIAAIDKMNQEDPSGKASAYGANMSAWVKRLAPKASEELRIAARGQHTRRWTSPRGKYPMDRGGYLRWREELKVFHAGLLAGLMRDAGYEDVSVERMRAIIYRRNLKENAEAQTLEDAACLVFLETDLEPLMAKTPAEKMDVILSKTWLKMSEQGHAEARKLKLSIQLPTSS